MKKEGTIFDDPRKARWFLRIFYISLVALLVLDFFIQKHAAFSWEGVPGFLAGYGLVSSVFLVLMARLWGILTRRDGSYYD